MAIIKKTVLVFLTAQLDKPNVFILFFSSIILSYLNSNNISIRNTTTTSCNNQIICFDFSAYGFNRSLVLVLTNHFNHYLTRFVMLTLFIQYKNIAFVFLCFQ